MNGNSSDNKRNLDSSAAELGKLPVLASAAGASKSSSNEPASGTVDVQSETMLDSADGDKLSKSDTAARKKMAKLLGVKEDEWTAVAKRKGPLRLLDLPMDILKEIVKEITHTNDLTALALTHSALHNLAIPHIYSRFDIVWPDALSTTDTRTGVDALTYGLATLVMGYDVFGNGGYNTPTPASSQTQGQSQNGNRTGAFGSLQRRLGNNYSQYTRKFSLGNGPSDWVQDYMITKESGKMLGTLVALAVARMVNLETFIWDMPTGVLRDVWLALSSLEHKSPPGECRLERVLVRWHDNSLDQMPAAPSSISAYTPAGGTVTPVGILVPPSDSSNPPDSQTPTPLDHNAPRNAVESPTLSVLPPLKSLSVLDIDELSYLDEMSILIERSKDKLQELRVGISKKACNRNFIMAWDGPELVQVDHNAQWPGAPSKISEKRLGGVLGIIFGRVFDIHHRKPSKWEKRLRVASLSGNSQAATGSTEDSPQASQASQPASISMETLEREDEPAEAVAPSSVVATTVHINPVVEDQGVPPVVDTESEAKSNEPLVSILDDLDLPVSSTITSPAAEISQLDISQIPLPHPTSIHKRPSKKDSARHTRRAPSGTERKPLDGKLRLRVLELERVPISVYTLQRGIDWTILTSITILDCAYHESLWRMLRRVCNPQSGTAKVIPNTPMDYRLNLKSIHTDIATSSLISFLKETLAPNSLEVLFLQDRRKTTMSSVTIDQIFRGPVKRHRKSLKKLLIDSSIGLPKNPASASENRRWQTWMLTHDALANVTSGSMNNLRELSVAIDYKDWHFFLRRLPNIPTLRSLNIPFIADHVTPAYDPKELASQIVNMIFLRPEIELCYLGISHKCFEILENRPLDDQNSTTEAVTTQGELDNHLTDDDDDDDGDDTDEDDEDNDDDEDDEDDGTATEAVEADGIEYEPSETNDESDNGSELGSETDSGKLSLRLREILFYDDKVAIFKARHMRL